MDRSSDKIVQDLCRYLRSTSSTKQISKEEGLSIILVEDRIILFQKMQNRFTNINLRDYVRGVNTPFAVVGDCDVINTLRYDTADEGDCKKLFGELWNNNISIRLLATVLKSSICVSEDFEETLLNLKEECVCSPLMKKKEY